MRTWTVTLLTLLRARVLALWRPVAVLLMLLLAELDPAVLV